MDSDRENDIVDRFYSTSRWRSCRTAYAKSKGHLCERCLSRGLIVPGEEVHHITKLTPQNVSDPHVALDWRNLILLCKRCHDEEHGKLRVRADPLTGHVDL